MAMEEYSISPSGEHFRLPSKQDGLNEFEHLKRVVNSHRALVREIVVVMGLGFVGAQ
jgi:hypothetical protein